MLRKIPCKKIYLIIRKKVNLFIQDTVKFHRKTQQFKKDSKEKY